MTALVPADASPDTDGLAAYQPAPQVRISHPEWSKNASIYQINTRQFTTEGTFRAAEAHLARLKDLGITIIWLMPIHPIGEVNRKGSLGSPYAVKDYFAVNAEFGDLEDLKHFIAAAHELGLYVILDWVANHTAWDSNLVTEHPEWYARDWKGDFCPTPWWDWDDIIDLDYRWPELRKYMTEALCYWVREAGVDGYRCDVAGFVPIDFWEQARRELDAIKPVFMLAEWETRDLHYGAFDASYSWHWNQTMHHLATGRATVVELFVYYAWNDRSFPQDIMRMMFVSNHDKNAWEGTEYEQFGDALDAAIVLSVVSEGIPLIYNGQEAGNDRRLAFFEKDPIIWREHRYADFYRSLFTLKRDTTALWNAHWGARMVQVPNDQPTRVLSFVRRNQTDGVFAIFNFSAASAKPRFTQSLCHGTYTDFTTSETVVIDDSTILELPAWGWRILLGAGGS